MRKKFIPFCKDTICEEEYSRISKNIIRMRNDMSKSELKIYRRWLEKNSKLKKPFGIYILKRGAKLVGLALLLADDQKVGKELKLKGLWIVGVFVEKKYRGRGYGKEIISQLIFIAKESKKFKYIYLFTDNPVALNIYKSFGFNEIAKVSRNNSKQIVLQKNL